MRSPEVVLSHLASKASSVAYKFQRVYRNLYNPDFYLRAYSKLAPNEGNMTKGIDGKDLDGMSLERIFNLIQRIRDQTYRPKPVRRVYIPKSNGKLRPLGIPSIEDKLVQEVVRSLLEAMFEGSFSKYSHGFRSNRSCHTALDEIKINFKGIIWFVEGDIKSFFDNIDHHILLHLIRKRVDDEKFLSLLWKFLRAGYLEDWQFNKTHSGTPQGGIFSPILSNIYLNELDQMVEKLKAEFNKGEKRKFNKEYSVISRKIRLARLEARDTWKTLSPIGKRETIRKIKALKNELIKIPSVNMMDENYKRLKYVRYADDFLIGITGSKSDALEIKQRLANFLNNHLNLELSLEKTLITHSSKRAKFLGYDVTVQRTGHVVRDKKGNTKRAHNYVPRLLVPHEKIRDKLIKLDTLKIKQNGTWQAKHRNHLLNHDSLEIISIFNAEIRGLYNYYKLAINVSSALHKFHYIMRYSFFKTMSAKHRTSMYKTISKLKIEDRVGMKYKTKTGAKIRYFYDEGFPQQKPKPETNHVDLIPNTYMYGGRTSLIERLLAEKCEWCGRENIPLQIHHVRKLKDLQGKKRWEKFMIARKRKTVAMCVTCHHALHAGKLD